MKILVIIVVIFNCAALPAQLKLFVHGGDNICQYNTSLLDLSIRENKKFYKHEYFLPFLGIGIQKISHPWLYKAGIYYSYRGFRDYFYEPIYNTWIYGDYAQYLEFPLTISYLYLNDKLQSGIGVVIHKRLDTDIFYEELNLSWGTGIRVVSNWNFSKRWSLELSYTLGNFDKFIHKKYETHMHHIFGIGIQYNFWDIKTKK